RWLSRHAPGGDGARGGRLLENDAAARRTLRSLHSHSLWLAARGLSPRSRHPRARPHAAQVLVSAFGLGLGFGLQQIMNNFVSGLILLFERPVQVGDSIQLGDLGGDVLRIGIRSSTLRTPQGAEVIVPNSKMIEDKVTNWTLSDRRRRIELDVGVTGDTDPERILALLADIARRDPRVSGDPPPEALLIRFGEAS